jgi:hypothetical protein
LKIILRETRKQRRCFTRQKSRDDHFASPPFVAAEIGRFSMPRTTGHFFSGGTGNGLI